MRARNDTPNLQVRDGDDVGLMYKNFVVSTEPRT